MKARILACVFFLGLLSAVSAARAHTEVPRYLTIAAADIPSAADEEWQLRPMKRGVGRAVTPTMDKIDNPWFVVSQILIPIAVILFSLMYVRRYTARQAAESDAQPTPCGKEMVENDSLASKNANGK